MTQTNSQAVRAALVAGLLVSAPLAARADTVVPHIPGPFVGAPADDDPNAGQFTVNFDGTGRFLGFGRAAEPSATIDTIPPRVRRQTAARARAKAAATEAVSARLRSQLRVLARTQRG